MKLDVPHDYECGADSDTRFSKGKVLPQLPPFQNSKRKKRRLVFSESHTQREHKKGDNYFQKMYSSTKKKLYVSMFIRKLRQGIALSTNFSHILMSEQNDKFYGSLQTFKWKQSLEAIFIVLLIIQTWIGSMLATLQIAFQQIRSSQQRKIIEAFIILLSIAEILYKILVKSKIRLKKSDRDLNYVKQSFKNYLESGWMIIDVSIIIVFIIDIAFDFKVLSYLKLLIMLKITHANQKLKNIQIIFIESNFKEQYWELIKVFIFNFLFAHFLAIILVILGNQPNSWVQHFQLNIQSWVHLYVWAYYWATNIMLTVGFGDISATNVNEALCLIFIQTLSCVVLAYNINSIGSIIQKITSYEQQKSANLKIFTKMQSDEGISEDIKKKVTDFIVQSSELKKKYNVTEQQQFLKKLPKTFFQQFKQQSTLKIFTNLPFFRNLSFKKLQEISVKIQKKLAHPQEILVQSYTVPKILIFNNGKISLHTNQVGSQSHGRQIQVIEADNNQYKLVSQYFMVNQPVNFQIRCKDYTITYCIEHKELKEILSTHPYSYEYYCMGRDRDRYNPNDLQVQICDLCSNKNHKAFHTLFDCPKLHYKPLRNLVIDRALKNPKRLQLKGHYLKERKMKIKMKALVIFSELQDMFAEIFVIKNQKGKTKVKIETEKQITFNEADQFYEYVTETQIATLKSKLVQSLSRKSQQDNLKKVCEAIGEQLKEQLIRNSPFMTLNNSEEFKWELDSDSAHDFAFYFQKQNPCRLRQNCRQLTLRKKGKKH